MPFERPYERFAITRPDFLGDGHWESISTELSRLDRSLVSRDLSQAIGDLKCLVESIAKVTLEINGTPATGNASFDTTVKHAHSLLASQPGLEITNTSIFGNMATQASKIARNLGDIRNEFGSGHGRARQPTIRAEMVDLALDGGFLWARWALRRIGLFSEGRPTELIRSLIGNQTEGRSIFYKGDLTRRLEAANLPSLESHHQRALGVAVARRAMEGTFIVSHEGVSLCLASDDTSQLWTRQYRIGLAHGLLFDLDEQPTFYDYSLRNALSALTPLPELAIELNELIDEVINSSAPGRFISGLRESFNLKQFILDQMKKRPDQEHTALLRLAEHVQPQPF